MMKYGSIFVHDMFNILSLLGIITIDIEYLYRSTIWDHMGTKELGSSEISLAKTFMSIFLIYIVIDTIWIAAKPTWVLSSPYALIIHHFFTFAFLLVPHYVPQFHWHGAVSVFVELNVILLASRWHFHQDGIVYKILDSLFLTTWFLFRIIVFPVLLIFYSYEYIRYSDSLGNVWLNIVLFAPILQVIGVTDNVKNAFLVFQWKLNNNCSRLFFH